MIRTPLVAAAVALASIAMASPAGADPVDDLFGMLPAGYSEGSCESRPVPAGSTAVAFVACRNNSLPGGPSGGSYVLYRDLDALRSGFAGFYNRPEFAAVPCPGGQSPAPGVIPGGSVTCAYLGGNAAVMWTRDADLFLGLVDGPGTTLDGLFGWLGASGAVR